MVRAATTIDLSGPFFEADPRKRLFENIRTMLEAIAAEGQSDVQAQFPVLTGAGRAGVVGRVHALNGRPWQFVAVISEQHVYPWPNGSPKQYRGGKTEAKRHMFRTTKTRLGRSRAVNLAELAKGLS